MKTWVPAFAGTTVLKLAVLKKPSDPTSFKTVVPAQAGIQVHLTIKAT